MSEQPSGEAPAPEGTAPPQEGQVADDALGELGIKPDEQGKIALADHQKLINTVKTLRDQVKSHEAAERKSKDEMEKARMASLGEAERAIEEARKEGYAKAVEEQHNTVVGAQVVAQAATAGFLDPDDALHHVSLTDLKDAAAIKAAVEKLAKDKPYLLKPKQGGRPIEQGPQGQRPSGSGDWLGDRIRGKRAG